MPAKSLFSTTTPTAPEAGAQLLKLAEASANPSATFRANVRRPEVLTLTDVLGQRVVVLTAGPARMAADITIDLPARRTLEIKTSEAFGRYSREIYALLGMA